MPVRCSPTLEKHLHVDGLEALLPLRDLEAHRLTFVQCAEAIRLDLREMNEQILAVRLLDEAVPLFGAEPLDGSLSQPSYPPCSSGLRRPTARPKTC
jgi:hypothetical protein